MLISSTRHSRRCRRVHKPTALQSVGSGEWLCFFLPPVAGVYTPTTLTSKAKEGNEAALLKAQQELQMAQAGGSQAHCIAICVTWWVDVLCQIACCSCLHTYHPAFEGKGGQ